MPIMPVIELRIDPKQVSLSSLDPVLSWAEPVLSVSRKRSSHVRPGMLNGLLSYRSLRRLLPVQFMRAGQATCRRRLCDKNASCPVLGAVTNAQNLSFLFFCRSSDERINSFIFLFCINSSFITIVISSVYY